MTKNRQTRAVETSHAEYSGDGPSPGERPLSGTVAAHNRYCLCEVSPIVVAQCLARPCPSTTVWASQRHLDERSPSPLHPPGRAWPPRPLPLWRVLSSACRAELCACPGERRNPGSAPTDDQVAVASRAGSSSLSLLAFSEKVWTCDARIVVAKRRESPWSASASSVGTRGSAWLWLWERGVIWVVEMSKGEGICA